MKTLRRAILWPMATLLVVVTLLVGSNFYVWHRLTDESLVAEIYFEPVADQHFTAWVASRDLCEPTRYTLYGDQWRIDAQFVKWRAIGNVLGLDSLYRLERLEGRYKNTQEQNRAERSAHSLARASALDLAKIATWLGDSNALLDTQFGSSVYLEIDPGLLYRVYRTQSGLVARRAPRIGQITNEGLRIDIHRACG